jgi:hypothetical protein
MIVLHACMHVCVCVCVCVRARAHAHAHVHVHVLPFVFCAQDSRRNVTPAPDSAWPSGVYKSESSDVEVKGKIKRVYMAEFDYEAGMRCCLVRPIGPCVHRQKSEMFEPDGM